MGNQCCSESHDDKETSSFRQNRSRAVMVNNEPNQNIRGNMNSSNVMGQSQGDYKLVEKMHPKATTVYSTLQILLP